MAVTQITAAEVTTLLARGAAASSNEDAIIAVVDRGGHILGVRVEEDVLDAFDALANGGNGNGMIDAGSSEEATLVFAIDGAVAKARTAAFFANGTADSRINPETGADPDGDLPTVGPLTSRTVRFISQSTITQREVQSNPNADPILQATLRGPGFVAPIGIGGHFPPAIAHTPQVDLFGIEHTNRDSLVHPGPDSIKGTIDDIALPGRFNATFDAGHVIDAPESYGFVSGRLPDAQSRGIATLPGGIPLYRGFDLVGGIGVFIPGTNGDATFEQGFVAGIGQTEKQRTNAAKVLEAEWIAFAAAGGSSNARADVGEITDSNGITIDDVPFDYPFGRIDLVGIALELIGPSPGLKGVRQIVNVGKSLGFSYLIGSTDGTNLTADSSSGADQPVNALLATAIAGMELPEGWLITPPAGSDAETIIKQGIAAAEKVRAAIRLKVKNVAKKTTVPGARTRMVLAVTDNDGDVLGLYRMHDSTVFSIDVAVAKARNTAYYASSAIEAADQVDDNNDTIPDLPKELAFTNRTFRFLAEPRYPQGVDGSKPGDFSILNDPGFKTDLLKSKKPNINTGAVENDPAAATPRAYTDFVSVLGFDSFNPGRNFRQPPHAVKSVANQNGVVFFPGSAPIYKSLALVGGFGVSGDGVDQDDVVTFFGAKGFEPDPADRADRFFVRGVRLPYQKFNRNPFA